MVFSGSDILLFKENWATGEREKHANGKLLRLPNGRLGFRLHDEEEVIFVEFEREENACTFFDLIGWK